MQVWVTVLVARLEHYGTKVRGDRFRCSRHMAEKLEARGKVKIEGEADDERPTTDAGGKSSASPAGQASPGQTVNVSDAGEAGASLTGGSLTTPPDSEDPSSSEDPDEASSSPSAAAKGSKRGRRRPKPAE